MKTQRGNLPVSAYTTQEFVVILTFNVCLFHKLVNQCLHTEIYSSQLKLSRVKLLLKSDDQSRFSNYRPISLLPSLSKILNM